jgi:hypothetical protein
MNAAAVTIMTAAVIMTAQAGDSLSAWRENDLEPGFFMSLVATGQVDMAAREYERLRFLGYADSLGLACELGAALLCSRDAARSEAVFTEAMDMAGGSAKQGDALSGLVRSWLMQRKSALVSNELDGLDSVAREAFGCDAITYYRGLTHASSYRVDSARQVLGALGDGSPFEPRARKIDSLLVWYRSRQMKNPLNAFLYSSAVPGWGQWYVGDRKKAVASFALMAALSGVLCYDGYRFYRGGRQERYVRGMDLFLVWGLAWRRYYGGIRKAAHQRAVEINRNVQLEYQERLRRIIAEE